MDDHDVITYEVEISEERIMSKTINADIVRTLGRVSTAEADMQTVENLLTAEQNQIAKADKKFASFLKINAITPFNKSPDKFIRYVDRNISAERQIWIVLSEKYAWKKRQLARQYLD